MLKEKIGEVKAMIQKEGEKNNKKKIENLVVFIVILIVTILVINMVWGSDTEKETKNSIYTQLAGNEKQENICNIKQNDEYNIGQDLEEILCKIDGAGKVKVLITYSESSKIVPLSNEKYKETQTEEGDKAGGSRKIEETDETSEIIYQESNGKKEIVTRKNYYA